MNVDAIQSKDGVDVVFLGDSITEGWTGHFYNRPDPRVEGALAVFQRYFSRDDGGKYEGLPQVSDDCCGGR